MGVIKFLNRHLNLTDAQFDWLTTDPNIPNMVAIIRFIEDNKNQDYNVPQEVSDFSQQAVEALISGNITQDEYNEVLAEPYIVISPEVPIVNIAEFLECFNLNQNAELTIYVKQPIPGSMIAINPGSDTPVGHTFIGISQGNNSSVFGVYPTGDANPFNPLDELAYGDNSNDSYDVSITINSTELTNIINGAINNTSSYDLNSYNCTDYGMEVSNLSGINLPQSYSNWGLGRGNNPAKLGEILRDASTLGATWNNAPTSGTYNINPNGGISPLNQKDCD